MSITTTSQIISPKEAFRIIESQCSNHDSDTNNLTTVGQLSSFLNVTTDSIVKTVTSIKPIVTSFISTSDAILRENTSTEINCSDSCSPIVQSLDVETSRLLKRLPSWIKASRVVPICDDTATSLGTGSSVGVNTNKASMQFTTTHDITHSHDNNLPVSVHSHFISITENHSLVRSPLDLLPTENSYKDDQYDCLNNKFCNELSTLPRVSVSCDMIPVHQTAIESIADGLTLPSIPSKLNVSKTVSNISPISDEVRLTITQADRGSLHETEMPIVGQRECDGLSLQMDTIVSSAEHSGFYQCVNDCQQTSNSSGVAIFPNNGPSSVGISERGHLTIDTTGAALHQTTLHLAETPEFVGANTTTVVIVTSCVTSVVTSTVVTSAVTSADTAGIVSIEDAVTVTSHICTQSYSPQAREQSEQQSNAAGLSQSSAHLVPRSDGEPASTAASEQDHTPPPAALISAVGCAHSSEREAAVRRHADDSDSDDIQVLESSMRSASSAPKRRNIREILSKARLDARTVCAQRLERERQRRLGMRCGTQSVAGGAGATHGRSRATVTQRTVPCQQHDVVVLSSDDEQTPPARDEMSVACGLARDRGGLPPVQDDDEDDIVLLSPTNEDCNAEDAAIDLCNTCDELGRVLVNVGHSPAECDVFLAPRLAAVVKPHQIGGIRFMYDNLIESLETCLSSPGFGCILAHAMGLGKTLQTIGFVDLFLRYTSFRTVLIIVPINTMQNWLNEFDCWLPDTGDHKQAAESVTPHSSTFDDGAPSLDAVESNSEITVTEEQTDSVRLSDSQLPSIDSVILSEFESSCLDTINLSEAQTLPTIDNDCVVSEALSKRTKQADKNEWGSTCELENNTSVAEDFEPRKFNLFVVNDSHRTFNARFKVIDQWQKDGGVLLIGYEMYRLLSMTSRDFSSKRRKRRSGAVEDLPASISQLDKNLRDGLVSALIDPGPDLVVCDEGHRVKNAGASISKALKKIRTRRRLALTGYPLQNNLLEYWCMVDFVRPNFLGTRAEFTNMFERPILNGQCEDSTATDVRLMRFRSHVLHSLLEGFVQRRSQTVLMSELPEKKDFVIMLRMSHIQRRLYNKFMRTLFASCTSSNNSPNQLKAFVVTCKIWNHPDILYNLFKQRVSAKDLEIEENVELYGATDVQKKRLTPHLNDDNIDRFLKDEITYDWIDDLFDNYTLGVLHNSTKMLAFKVILEQSILLGDKLLVFSQSLFTLDIIEKFLGDGTSLVSPTDDQNWTLNKNYLRLDGSINSLDRAKLIQRFNSEPRLVLFLISTRAGCLGVNLVAANRVLVFDASWNPCHDAQAVCRIYRFGQRKCCYIYRLVADNSMERRIYNKQVRKQIISYRVVDETNPGSSTISKGDNTLLMDDINEEEGDVSGGVTTTTNSSQFSVDEYSDVILQHIIEQIGQYLTIAPFEHESMFVDRKDRKLTIAEKRLAHRGYELEKSGVLSTPVTSRPTIYPCSSMISQLCKPVANVKPYISVSRQYNSISHSRSNLLDGGIFSHNSPSSLSPAALAGVSTTIYIVSRDFNIGVPHTNSFVSLVAGQSVLLIKSRRGLFLRLSDGRFIPISATQSAQLFDHLLPAHSNSLVRKFDARNSLVSRFRHNTSHKHLQPAYNQGISRHNVYAPVSLPRPHCLAENNSQTSLLSTIHPTLNTHVRRHECSVLRPTRMRHRYPSANMYTNHVQSANVHKLSAQCRQIGSATSSICSAVNRQNVALSRPAGHLRMESESVQHSLVATRNSHHQLPSFTRQISANDSLSTFSDRSNLSIESILSNNPSVNSRRLMDSARATVSIYSSTSSFSTLSNMLRHNHSVSSVGSRRHIPLSRRVPQLPRPATCDTTLWPQYGIRHQVAGSTGTRTDYRLFHADLETDTSTTLAVSSNAWSSILPAADSPHDPLVPFTHDAVTDCGLINQSASAAGSQEVVDVDMSLCWSPADDQFYVAPCIDVDQSGHQIVHAQDIPLSAQPAQSYVDAYMSVCTPSNNTHVILTDANNMPTMY